MTVVGEQIEFIVVFLDEWQDVLFVLPSSFGAFRIVSAPWPRSCVVSVVIGKTLEAHLDFFTVFLGYFFMADEALSIKVSFGNSDFFGFYEELVLFGYWQASYTALARG